MSLLDTPTRITLSFLSFREASRSMYPSETAGAKRKPTLAVRERHSGVGRTEIWLGLSNSCVAKPDTQKTRQGQRSRAQAVEQLLLEGSSVARQMA